MNILDLEWTCKRYKKKGQHEFMEWWLMENSTGHGENWKMDE